MGEERLALPMAEGRPLFKISMDLEIEKTSFLRSTTEEGNSDWETIKRILNYLGFEAKVVRLRFRPARVPLDSGNIIPFPRWRTESQEFSRGRSGEEPLKAGPKVRQLVPREDQQAAYCAVLLR